MNLAVEANKNSVRLAAEGDKEAWLALYRDDAVVRDPVGKSPFDESGNGHVGKEAIGAFYDTVIAPTNLKITVHDRCPSGKYHCAVSQTAENDLGGGLKTKVHMIAVYEVDEEGMIKSMSAYWDFDEIQNQLKEQGVG